jgi:hypothetical protein
MLFPESITEGKNGIEAFQIGYISTIYIPSDYHLQNIKG